MAQEEQDPTPAENSPEEPAEAAPALNRAERRAQAKGKKAPASNSNPAMPQRNMPRGFGGFQSGGPTKNRLPRTGHK